jgi:hypothetical protein
MRWFSPRKEEIIYGKGSKKGRPGFYVRTLFVLT